MQSFYLAAMSSSTSDIVTPLVRSFVRPSVPLFFFLSQKLLDMKMITRGSYIFIQPFNHPLYPTTIAPLNPPFEDPGIVKLILFKMIMNLKINSTLSLNPLFPNP